MADKHDLINAIYTNDTLLFFETLRKTRNVTVVPYKGRPLCIALQMHRMDMAKALIDKGADPNYVDDEFLQDPIICIVDGKYAPFLLRHGAHIPLNRRHYHRRESAYNETKSAINAYVDRPWTPTNHLSWPIPLVRQVRTILVLARGRRKIHLVFLHMDTLLLLLSFVAARSWTYS